VRFCVVLSFVLLFICYFMFPTFNVQLSFPGHLRSPSIFTRICFTKCLVFNVVYCGLFLSFFLWSLVCLTSGLHLLITSLVQNVYVNVHILFHLITIVSTFFLIYHINKIRNKRFLYKGIIWIENCEYKAMPKTNQTRTHTKIVNVTRWFGMICSFTPYQLCPSWRHNTRILCLCMLVIVCLRLFSICLPLVCLYNYFNNCYHILVSSNLCSTRKVCLRYWFFSKQIQLSIVLLIYR